MLEIKLDSMQEEADILSKNMDSLMSPAWQERVRVARERAYPETQQIQDLRTRKAALLHRDKALEAVLAVYRRFLHTD